MIVLGINANPDLHPQVKHVLLSDDARRLGTYITGTTGTGKTTLLSNMILQDIFRQGSGGFEGLCVLDPHGDFIFDIMARIPPERLNDVILFDPDDIEFPFGLNILDCDRDNPRERDRVVSTVIDALYKLFYYSWGPRMEELLRNSLLTLLLHPEPTTLIDLMLLLVSYEHRQRLTERAKQLDPMLRLFWMDEFPEHTISRDGYLKRPREQTELISSSLNKIGRFITNPIIRHIVGQPQSTLNLRQIMDEGKILLVNLSKGKLGADNSSLLGAILVHQLLIAALSRNDVPVEQRRLFHLYVDEYQNFATPAFPELQSEARKYAIDTVVAHQYRDQLDEENRGSTLNVANLIVLRVSGRDAMELARQFDNTPEQTVRYERLMMPIDDELVSGYDTYSGDSLYQAQYRWERTYNDVHGEMANILATLPNHQAICRVLTAKTTPKTLHQFRIDLLPLSPINESYAAHALNVIRSNSRRMTRFTRETIAAYIDQQTSTHTPVGDNSGHIPASELIQEEEIFRLENR